MAWTEKDLQNLKNKGFKINDNKNTENDSLEVPGKKIVKISVEKNTIEFILMSFKQKGLINDFVTEHKFDDKRKYRFDWAIIDLKIAFEYEGIVSDKSRHTSLTGFSNDCSKYNLAIQKGWKVLRYTALNYQEIENDLIKLLNK